MTVQLEEHDRASHFIATTLSELRGLPWDGATPSRDRTLRPVRVVIGGVWTGPPLIRFWRVDEYGRARILTDFGLDGYQGRIRSDQATSLRYLATFPGCTLGTLELLEVEIVATETEVRGATVQLEWSEAAPQPPSLSGGVRHTQSFDLTRLSPRTYESTQAGRSA